MSVKSEDEVHSVNAEDTASAGQISAVAERDVDDNASTAFSNKEDICPPKRQEEDLTETELRRVHEEEEIERFLGLFADYVNEVKIPSTHDDMSQGDYEDLCEPRDTKLDPPSFELLGSDWLLIKSERIPKTLPLTLDSSESICEQLALKYILPALPPTRPRPDKFTVGRFRLAVQRLYLVAYPAYTSFLSRMLRLACWKDKQSSGIYCCLFWTFWYRDILMPMFFFRILFCLLRRRLFAYPTVEELRARRREAELAAEFGEELQMRLGASSKSGILEAWRLFRVFSKPKRSKAKETLGKGSNVKGTEKKKDEAHDGAERLRIVEENDGSERNTRRVDDVTVLDDPRDSKEERDFKRAMLNVFSDSADFHERIRNIVLWRNPAASRIYVVLLVCLIAFTAFLPTKYIIKTGTFTCGVLFWHIAPVIACLPPEDRERLPPPFDNAPTDAEYALELISQRVSKGEAVKPARPLKKKRSFRDSTTEKDDYALQNSASKSMLDEKNQRGRSKSRQEFDWRGLGDKAQAVHKWAGQSGLLRSRNKQNTVTAGSSSQPQNDDNEADTYLAHYGTTPGILSLSSASLSFAPATSTRPKLRIAYGDIIGVKKIGMAAMPGLSIKWKKNADSSSFKTVPEEASTAGLIEEKFWWVGGRDEVFAKLVGFGGRKWVHV